MNYFGIPGLSLPESFGNPQDLSWEKWGRIARTKVLGDAWGYHFYTNDHQFTGCWNEPDKVVNSGVLNIVELNYSTYKGQPRATFLSDLYRKRSLSAYWQSLGLTIWVDMNVEPELYDLNSLGVPDGYPYFATRYQATLPDGTEQGLEGIEADYIAACRTAGLERVDLLVYGGSKNVQDYCKAQGYYWVPDSNGWNTKRFKSNQDG